MDPIRHVPAIVVREAQPGDFDRYFDEGFQELSAESRHLRFFTAIRELPENVRARLADVDGVRNAAVLAFDAAVMMDDHPEGFPIGVARWISDGDGPPELSITVIDAYQGMGVGTRLMDALLALARKRGVHRIMADVLRENTGMRTLINRYRAVVQRSGDPLVVRYRLDV
jgi:GNAT superfamily N-acetyltransferase